jgi:predicted MFS family arabinose efflux permease
LQLFDIFAIITPMSAPPHIKEKQVIAALSGLYALRMLGLFLIYPVLAIYAAKMPGATPFLLGLAMGIYGLSQAVLQIPFGILSDKFGRKPLIVIGLLLFAGGSIIAALSTDIYGLILGRILQGTGAISAVITALLADLLAPQKRAKAMAIVGLTIGMAFGLSLILAPALGAAIGLSGLFWVITVLILLSLVVLIFFVPQPVKTQEAIPRGQWRIVFANRQLWLLNISAFFLHGLLTTLFLWMPARLNELASAWYSQSLIYFVLLLGSYAFMMPILIRAEKTYRQKWVLQGSILGFILALLYFAWMPNTLWHLLLGLLLFLIPFNLLEATLPSWVSRLAPQQTRGAAMGMYATAQFLGIFIGGVSAGWLLNYFSLTNVFLSLSLLMLIWFILVRGLKRLSKQE